MGAIKKTVEVKIDRPVPKGIAQIFARIFTLNVIRDGYKVAGDELKEEAEELILKSRKFELPAGTSVKTDEGLVSHQERTPISVETKEVMKLIKAGSIAVETVINLASFSAGDLKKVLTESQYEAVTKSGAPTASLVFRPTDEFKKRCQSEFAAFLPPALDDEGAD